MTWPGCYITIAICCIIHTFGVVVVMRNSYNAHTYNYLWVKCGNVASYSVNCVTHPYCGERNFASW